VKAQHLFKELRATASLIFNPFQPVGHSFPLPQNTLFREAPKNEAAPLRLQKIAGLDLERAI
jgi:hypothetical protein